MQSIPVIRELREAVHRILVVDRAGGPASIPLSGKAFLIVPFDASGLRGDLAYFTAPPTRPFVVPAVEGRHRFVAVELSLAGQWLLFERITGSACDLVLSAAELGWSCTDLPSIQASLARRLRRRRDRAAMRVAALEAVLPHARTVGAAAGVLGISPATLRRDVTRICGRSPRTILQERRMGHTFCRVYDHDAPDLTHIAHDLDFADLAHLSRAMRAFSGTPPSRLDRNAFGLARAMYG